MTDVKYLKKTKLPKLSILLQAAGAGLERFESESKKTVGDIGTSVGEALDVMANMARSGGKPPDKDPFEKLKGIKVDAPGAGRHLLALIQDELAKRSAPSDD